jgi:hypothetical protein
MGSNPFKTISLMPRLLLICSLHWIRRKDIVSLVINLGLNKNRRFSYSGKFGMNGTKRKRSCDCCNEFILQIQISHERETLQVLIGNTDKLDISEMLTRSADFKMAASMREKKVIVC